jgi:hypothetical protein
MPRNDASIVIGRHEAIHDILYFISFSLLNVKIGYKVRNNFPDNNTNRRNFPEKSKYIPILLTFNYLILSK